MVATNSCADTDSAHNIKEINIVAVNLFNTDKHQSAQVIALGGGCR